MEKNSSIHNMKQFFEQDTVSLAKNLLGKLVLVKKNNELLGGYIVETEAYLGVVDRPCLGKREQFIFILCTHTKCSILSAVKKEILRQY